MLHTIAYTHTHARTQRNVCTAVRTYVQSHRVCHIVHLYLAAAEKKKRQSTQVRMSVTRMSHVYHVTCCCYWTCVSCDMLLYWTCVSCDMLLYWTCVSCDMLLYWTCVSCDMLLYWTCVSCDMLLYWTCVSCDMLLYWTCVSCDMLLYWTCVSCDMLLYWTCVSCDMLLYWTCVSCDMLLLLDYLMTGLIYLSYMPSLNCRRAVCRTSLYMTLKGSN